MTGAVAPFEVERFEWAAGAFEVQGRWGNGGPPTGRVRLLVEVDGRRRRLSPQSRPDGTPWQARFGCARRPSTVGPAELEVGGELVIVLPPAEVAPEPAPDVRGAEALLQSLRSERVAVEEATSRLASEREAAEAAAERLAAERAGVEAAREATADAVKETAAEAAREAASEVAREASEETRGAAVEIAREAAAEAAADAVRETAADVIRETAAEVAREAAREAAETQALPMPAHHRRAPIREPLELPREPRSALADAPRERNTVGYALAAALVMLIVVVAVLLLL